MPARFKIKTRAGKRHPRVPHRLPRTGNAALTRLNLSGPLAPASGPFAGKALCEETDRVRSTPSRRTYRVALGGHPAIEEPRLVPQHQGRQRQHLAAELPRLNPFQAVNDLLGPILKTLELFDPRPWELLPGGVREKYTLRGLDEPYVEMLSVLHDLWYNLTHKPLRFYYQSFDESHTDRYLSVHHAEPTRRGQYQLVSVTDIECEYGYLVAVEYLLHWRLSTKDKLSRKFQRLNFLALSLLEYTLAGDLCETFPDRSRNESHYPAYMEFFEIYEQAHKQAEAKMVLGKQTKYRTFTAKQVADISNEAGEHNGNGALYCFINEYERYGKQGPVDYFKELLARYRKVFYRNAVKNKLSDEHVAERHELVHLYDELLPLARTPQQKRVCEMANLVEQLYVSWPTDHVYSRPCLHAYSQDSEWSKPEQGLLGPDACREGDCLLEYYQLPFSLEDLTGTAYNQEVDMYLDNGNTEGPIWVTRALADGSLPLLHNGQVDPSHESVLPPNFPVRVAAAMEKLLEIDRLYADSIEVKRAFCFDKWFSPTKAKSRLKKLLGYWHYDTLLRLSKKRHADYSPVDAPIESKGPNTLLHVLGSEDPDEHAICTL